MIYVVNKYKHQQTTYDVYIGRGSALGNPYSHKFGGLEQFIVKTREDAILMYRKHLASSVLDGNMEVINELRNIAFKAKSSIVYCVCFCKPASCHGDVIVEYCDRILSGTLTNQWLLFQKNL